LYQISNMGRVKNKDSHKRSRLNPNGYFLVDLYNKNIRKTYRVNKLVANEFIENTKNKEMVNHKNGIKTDNKASNLEWCTRSENSIHAYKNKLKLPVSKPVIQYDNAGNYIKTYSKVTDAEKDLSISHISSVCKGKQKTAGGFIWRYEKESEK